MWKIQPIMRRLFKFLCWFWSGAVPTRQWRYFIKGQRRKEHAHLQEFHLRFAPFALSQAALGLPWAVAALLAPSNAKVVFLILAALKLIGGGAVAGAVIHFSFPIRANERELRGRTFIGLSRRVTWQNIESVRSRRWLFTPFLLVSSRGETSALWLPLFLCEQHKFERCVEDWLAPQHPVRRFLEDKSTHHTLSSAEANSCQTS